MSMTYKIFAGSSIFIVPLKGNKVNFYQNLIPDFTNDLFATCKPHETKLASHDSDFFSL
jgi:hypothetical protein